MTLVAIRKMVSDHVRVDEDGRQSFSGQPAPSDPRTPSSASDTHTKINHIHWDLNLLQILQCVEIKSGFVLLVVADHLWCLGRGIALYRLHKCSQRPFRIFVQDFTLLGFSKVVSLHMPDQRGSFSSSSYKFSKVGWF